jgi:hypothetical protein
LLLIPIAVTLYLGFENLGNVVEVLLPSIAHTQAPVRSYTPDERYDIGVIGFDMVQLAPYANTGLLDRFPYYANFRHLMSHPKIHKQIIKLLIKKVNDIGSVRISS